MSPETSDRRGGVFGAASRLGPYLGLDYREALEIAPPPYRVLVTRPYKNCLGSGALRVVAERPTPLGSLWVLAYSHYRRLPRQGVD